MSYANPIETFSQRVKKHPDKAFLHQPINRQWQVTTWRQAFEKARIIAAGLKSLKLVPGDRVAILSKNCAEWFIADFAIMMAGLVSVPIYPTANQNTINYVLSNSGAKAIFIGKLDDPDNAVNAISDAVATIAFPYPTGKTTIQWNDWLSQFEPMEKVHQPKPDETMTIVYTSGSTGNPKGAVISYFNYSSVCETHQKFLNLNESDRILSYLPLAHIAERGVVEGPGIYAGISFYFVESLDTFIDDLKYTQPTLFHSVPRLWTRFQTGVFEKIPAEKLDRLLSIPLLGKLIAKKIRQGLGIDKARIYGSGSAPISKSILAWYNKIGIGISEGWGMTETTGLSCSNYPFDIKSMGSIGKPLDCVEMKLSDQGEILIRGDAVFQGYYNNPKATADSFEDGWFKTGDKGVLAEDGSYQIIGRVKEEFKTSKGKYVAPVPIESMIATNPNIEQICVLGQGRKQPVAIVVLAEHLANADMAPIKASLSATLKMVNAELENHQQLDYMVVASEPWSVENEFLTPTMKIRRAVLETRYEKLISNTLDGLVFWESELVVKI